MRYQIPTVPTILRLRRSALMAGLALAISHGTVWAQSNSSGAIFGQAVTAPGSTVVIENLDTGLSRTISIDANGRYRASSLPIGRYSVSLQKDGHTISRRDNVQVTIAGATDVSFAGSASTKTLEGVTVVASALPQIDVSSVDTRTVLTADQLAKIPMARNVAAAALLAPGVMRGDSRFPGEVLAMGGSGISENAYTINGYNVTNPQTNETFFEMPFGAIEQQQVLTGGLGAEFGHSTGGVINIVGKRGTNVWQGNVSVFWAPAGLRSSPNNYMYPLHPEGTYPQKYASDGKLRLYREKNTSTETTLSVSLGGPLIKDRLFFYGAADFTRITGQRINPTGTVGYNQTTGAMLPSARNPTSGWQTYTDKPTKWYTKLDWNITDNHLLEVTALQDNLGQTTNNYGFDYTTLAHNVGTPSSVARTKNNNSLYLGKYTGYITDNLTVTALYGQSEGKQPQLTVAPDFPLVRGNAASPVVGRLHNYQPYANLSTGKHDKTDGWRLDVEYRLGAHDLRAGIDSQTLKSTTGEMYANEDKYGGYWRYEPNVALPAGYPRSTDPNGVVRLITHKLGGSYKTELNAQYVEDHWQVNDRWLAYIGLRNESFQNYNRFGQTFMKQSNQLAPRLGVSWDVNGDSTLKVYANAGRYYLGLPNGVAVRGAGGSLNTTQWFSFTGIDPATDLPTGLKALTPALSPNAEFGTPRDPSTVRTKDIRAHYQDEFILGLDKQLTSELTVGARATYRILRSQVDDTSDARPVCKYLVGNYRDLFNGSEAICNAGPAGGGLGYPGVIFNPGSGADFNVDVHNYAKDPTGKADLRRVVLSAKDLGMPAPKRKYVALDLYVEHPFDGKWYGRVDYTWSHSYGNTEGQIKSDLAQADVASSQDWDFPEFMRFANGSLPNDRRHQIRAFGYYQLTPEWLVSATVLANSGRPKNCLGEWFPDATGDTDPSGYIGSNGIGAYHVCYGKASPRGAIGNLPWTYQLDLGVSYRPAFAGKRLAFDVNVFNVTNSQRKITINESAIDQAGTANTIYGATLGTTPPRYVRMAVKYDFSL